MSNFIVADLSLFSLKWLKISRLACEHSIVFEPNVCLRPKQLNTTLHTQILQRCDYHLLLMKDTIQGHVKQRILLSPIKYCPMLRKELSLYLRV